jgi:two-component system response regulator YesN
MFTILLVDDEKNERVGIRFLIDKFAFPLSVEEASNGKAALEYIKNHHIDMLLTDIKMPFMDGIELAKAVQEYDDSITIIIFSAFSEFEYARGAIEARAVNYLLKPIDVSEFEKTMRSVIKQHQERREKEKERRNADEMQTLFQVLSSSSPIPLKIDVNRLPEHIVHAKWFILVNVETRNSLFLKHEDEFLYMVKSKCPCCFTYVNLYPNAAYLILYSENQVNETQIDDFIQQMHKDIVQIFKESCSLLIGSCFNLLDEGSAQEELVKQAVRLNTLRSTIFEGAPSVLYAKDLEAASEISSNTSQIEVSREKVIIAIMEAHWDEVSLRLEQFAKVLENSGVLSMIYLHYLLYEIISRLYQSKGITDKAYISRYVEDAVSAAQNGKLSYTFKSIMLEIRKSSTQNSTAHKRAYSVTEHVLTIIESEYDKDINLDYIAEKVHLTPSYLSFLYKQETGSNIVKQLSDYRMKKAREMLLSGNLKINDIAQRCGYDNPSYFNRLFKNIYGVTPKQYREEGGGIVTS